MYKCSLFFIQLLLLSLVYTKDFNVTDCPPSINVKNILNHLSQLDLIASVNGGNRAAGTSGYQASLGYIVSQLRTTNLQVRTQDFTFISFKVIGTPALSQTLPIVRDFVYLTDFRILSGSGSVNFTSKDVSVVPNLGCNAGDYTEFPTGSIALIARGECPFTQKAALAESAGAVALIIYNNQGGLFGGSINSTLAAIGVSQSLGFELSGPSVKLSLSVRTLKEVSLTSNVFAETIAGDPNAVIIVGSHLDSVTAGAGINDNGSGSAANLEMALTIAQCLPNPKNKIRFAWWGAEELGLLGSRYFIEDLVNNNPGELSKIALNLNFDMIGSPNFFYGIYNGSGAAPIIRDKCILIQREFEAAITSLSKPFRLTPFSGRSDYGPFIEVGIPAGGLFSGAEEIKDSKERTIYKGLANTAYDPCYHDYCDSFENISEEGLTTLANVAFKVTIKLATTIRAQKTKNYGFSLSKPLMTPQHPDAISHY
jgi:Zn-dependent M28 family amino/carboxypeptidase